MPPVERNIPALNQASSVWTIRHPSAGRLYSFLNAINELPGEAPRGGEVLPAFSTAVQHSIFENKDFREFVHYRFLDERTESEPSFHANFFFKYFQYLAKNDKTVKYPDNFTTEAAWE